jgi:hypothetical protein
VFEKYWDYLPCLDQHLNFGSESQYTQHNTWLFSEALSRMSFDDAFEHKRAPEAKQTDIEISEDAAIARLRLIQDLSGRSTGNVRTYLGGALREEILNGTKV